MPILSYNCLNKLNIFPMHLFRFQRTWFYPANQGHLRPRYQTISTIKGTLRHNRKVRICGGGGEGEREMEIQGESLEVQKIYSQSFKSPTREGKEKGDKTRESQGVGIRPISLRLFEISHSLQRNICQKHAHIKYHSPTKSSSPNYLGRQCPRKATWT